MTVKLSEEREAEARELARQLVELAIRMLGDPDAARTAARTAEIFWSLWEVPTEEVGAVYGVVAHEMAKAVAILYYSVAACADARELWQAAVAGLRALGVRPDAR